MPTAMHGSAECNLVIIKNYKITLIINQGYCCLYNTLCCCKRLELSHYKRHERFIP